VSAKARALSASVPCLQAGCFFPSRFFLMDDHIPEMTDSLDADIQPISFYFLRVPFREIRMRFQRPSGVFWECSIRVFQLIRSLSVFNELFFSDKILGRRHLFFSSSGFFFSLEITSSFPSYMAHVDPPNRCLMSV